MRPWTVPLLAALALGLSNPAQAQSLVSGQVNTGTPSYVTNQYAPLQLDAAGALKSIGPTAATGKIVQTSVALSATTSTQLVAANTSRIALEIQCDGTAAVGVDRAGAVLTSVAASPLIIPPGSYPIYTMPAATLTAITAYTGTAQTCRVTEYIR